MKFISDLRLEREHNFSITSLASREMRARSPLGAHREDGKRITDAEP